jgi:lauroyl/myristoyl acyltransferase
VGAALILGVWMSRRWTGFDYGILLPLMARLPIPLGRWVARLRGRCYAAFKRDWRTFSFGDTKLYERTFETIKALMPELTKAQCHEQVARRYEAQSLEEFEGACLPIRDIASWPLHIEGLDELVTQLALHPRVVFVTSHFGSSILGTAMLGCLGLPVLGMSSNVVEDPRVHPAIGRFYRRKYAAMAPYLRGGEVLDRQGNASKFVRFLLRGGAVVIVGDLPPDPHEQPLVKSFLGRPRGFAPGAAKLAQMTHAKLLAFTCVYGEGKYVLRFSKPEQDPYEFIGTAIRAAPSLWWAADLLPLLPEFPDE